MNKQIKETYTRQDGKVFEAVNIGCYVNTYVLREVKEKKGKELE